MAYNKGEGDYNKGGQRKVSRYSIYGILFIIIVLAGIYYYKPIIHQLNIWQEKASVLFDKKADIEDEDILLIEVVEDDTTTMQNIVTHTTIDVDSASADVIDMQNIIEAVSPVVPDNTPTDHKSETPPLTKANTDQPQKTPEIKTNKRALKSFTGNNRKYGFKDADTGEIIIEAQYDYYLRVPEKEKVSYLAVKKGNKYGIIDLNNQIITPFIYDNVDWIRYPNYWKVSQYDQNRKYRTGLINASTAKICVPLEYDDLNIIGPASFILAKKNGLYGCIDNNNKITVPIKYNSYSTSTSSYELNNSVTFYDQENNKFCFDRNGQVLDCK
jgi:hypothetical protein